jgi:hypothetical protein
MEEDVASMAERVGSPSGKFWLCGHSILRGLITEHLLWHADCSLSREQITNRFGTPFAPAQPVTATKGEKATKGGFVMVKRGMWSVSFVSAIVLTMGVTAGAPAQAQEEALVPPEPAVPEQFTIAGEFVRVAYNNEGYATLGYRVANDSVGDEWMLLEVGLTMREGVKNYTLEREHLSLQTPDGSTIPLATQQDFRKANLRALDRRASAVRDSINYFPVSANRPCTMNFFADPGGGARTLAYDQVELGWDRACIGRVYFLVPGGIQTGQHWLNVKFAESVVQVPFRILTEAEQKAFHKQWKQLKKEHEGGKD